MSVPVDIVLRLASTPVLGLSSLPAADSVSPVPVAGNSFDSSSSPVGLSVPSLSTTTTSCVVSCRVAFWGVAASAASSVTTGECVPTPL